MRHNRGDSALLFDMLTAAEAVLRISFGKSRIDLDKDEVLRWAIERQVSIVGEAACQLTKELKAANPHVPWQKIMTTRHVLVHDYDAVNPDTVWFVVTVHLPLLISQLRPMLPPPPNDPLPEDHG